MRRLSSDARQALDRLVERLAVRAHAHTEAADTSGDVSLRLAHREAAAECTRLRVDLVAWRDTYGR